MELTISTMKIDVTPDTISQIKEKTKKIFSRVRDNIMSVKLTIDDVNGPKGGVDKKCTVVVYCRGLPNIVVTNNEQSVVKAVNTALNRARNTLIKKLKRSHNHVHVKLIDHELSTDGYEQYVV